MLNDFKKKFNVIILIAARNVKRSVGLGPYTRPAINNKTTSSHARSSLLREPY